MSAPRHLCLFLATLAAGCGSRGGDDEPSLTLARGDSRVLVAPDGAVELRHGDEVRLRFGPDAIQLGLVDGIDEGHSYDPYWLEVESELIPVEPPPGLRWRSPVSATATEVSDEVHVEVRFGGTLTAQVVLRAEREDHFSMRVLPRRGAPVGFIRVQASVDPDEGLYGLGGAPDHVNHRGFIRPMQMEPDLTIESSNNEIHVPVPLLIGTRGWGLFVQSRRLGVFNVATEDDERVEITYGTAEQSDDGLVLDLFGAPRPLDVLKSYYLLTGQARLPARWVYGPLIWRDENRDQAQVFDDIERIRDLDLATSGIWIDRPYATAVNTFDFDADKFDDPEAMITRAHEAGLRVALWHTPYLEEATGELRQEAEARGFFPPEVGLRLNRWSDPIDFTNPEAYAWWQGLIERYTSMGIEGFKLDYGEDLLPGIAGARTKWTFADGSTDRTMHYRYTRLYHQVYADTLPETGGMLLCRAGRWGDQVDVSVIWPGDLDADLSKFGDRVEDPSGETYVAVGGLPTSVNMDLNLGASGFPFYGADTGGYRHSPPDNETFIRWFQQTALSSVMQVGDSSSQTPWEFTDSNGRAEATLDLYRRFARLHLRLFPYAWTYATRIAETGHPLTRALGLAYPELGAHPNDVYMFGDDLLVAPVLEAGARQKRVMLPTGVWYGWFDGTVFEGRGEEIEVDAPLEALPLFVRSGALVPMLRPNIDTLAATVTSTIESYANDPGLLWVRVAPAEDSERHAFVLFDGGEVHQRREGDGIRLGYLPGDELRVGVVFEVYADRAPREVRLDGEPLTEVPGAEAFESASEGWRFSGGRLLVRVRRSSEVDVTVVP